MSNFSESTILYVLQRIAVKTNGFQRKLFIFKRVKNLKNIADFNINILLVCILRTVFLRLSLQENYASKIIVSYYLAAKLL